jgi:hypothetical protein
MKKFTSLLISCSLALAGAAMAQQPDEQASPKPNQAAEKGKGRGPKAGDAAKAPEAAPAQERGVKREAVAPKAPPTTPSDETAKPPGAPAERNRGKRAADAPKLEKAEATPKAAASVAPTTKAASEPAASATPDTKSQAERRQKEVKAPTPAPTAKASATPAATATAAATATPAAKVTSTPSATATATVAPATATLAATASAAPATSATQAASASASAAPSASAAAATGAVSPTPATSASVAAATNAPIPTPKPNTAAATKKPDEQKVQQIKIEHANFRAQARPEQVPAVTFNQNYRVEGSDRWQGRQYEAFRSYRPERHDEGYYRSRYSRVELIGGGYYYQHNNYWYPAWGYNPRNEYYAYDGPIYVGHRSEPPDRVIADVQAALQQMGYYTGEVDGLLGPLTRKALIGYQEDAGLQATAAIDEPTLDTLNLGS